MVQRKLWIAALVGMVAGPAAAADPDEPILKTRDAVWRAWFANDRQTLERLVPAEAIAISGGEAQWKGRVEILRSAAEFQAQGGKLIRLEFPRTKVQRFAEAAFVYAQYVLETEVGGKRSVSSGRVTEVFVLRQGEWINPGWHTDSEK